MKIKTLFKSTTLFLLVFIFGVMLHSCTKESIEDSPVGDISINVQSNHDAEAKRPPGGCNVSPCTFQQLQGTCDCPSVCNCTVTITVEDVSGYQAVTLRMYVPNSPTGFNNCFMVEEGNSGTFSVDGGNFSKTKYKLQASQFANPVDVTVSGCGIQQVFENMTSQTPVDICLGNGCPG